MTRLAQLAGAYLIACLAGGIYATDTALHRPRVALTPDDTAKARALAAELGAGLRDVSVTAADGTTHHGWLMTPPHPSGDAVLVFHGIVANRVGVLEAARMFVAQGHTTLLADVRAHGDSGGDIGTFGVWEANDARRWLARLAQDARPGGCLYLFGTSLGAAVAIHAADAPRVCAVVADSPYSSLRDVVYDRINQRLHLPRLAGQTLLRPAVELGFVYARLRYGVWLGDASAAAQIAHDGPPVLVIHGALDDNSPPANAERLHLANPRRVDLWIVDGAGHGQALRITGNTYHERLRNFLAAHRGPQ
jgi:pimeloyl-ACP methyl ester carboxylesterase